MKRLLCLLLSIVFTFAIVGCAQVKDRDVDIDKYKDSDYDNDDADDNVYEHNEEKDLTCDICGGSGMEACTVCDGLGTYDGGYGYAMDCAVCGATGLYECSGCSGTGKVKDYTNIDGSGGSSLPTPTNSPIIGGGGTKNCVRCNNQGTIVCTFCNGSGGWNETKYAPDFSGNGNNSYQTRQMCYTCSGKGVIDCPNCY